MKWGKKNGPPYPLGTEDHSAAEKKAGWKKSLKANISSLKKTAKKHPILTVAALSSNQPEHLLLANYADKKKQQKELSYNDIVNKYKGNYKHGFLEGQEEKVVKNTIMQDKSHIAKSIVNEAVSDMERWAKEEGKTIKIDNKTKADMLKRIESNLDSASGFYPFSDGTTNFNISGLKEYSDGQPLSVDYNPETKKVSYDWL